MRWLFVGIFSLLTACACSTTPTTHTTETGTEYTCDTLNQIWQNEIRDTMMIESCMQSIPLICGLNDTTCVQSNSLICIEQYFDEKKIQTKAVRELECWRQHTTTM